METTNISIYVLYARKYRFLKSIPKGLPSSRTSALYSLMISVAAHFLYKLRIAFEMLPLGPNALQQLIL